MFARIGVMRALNRHFVPEFNPKGKETALRPAQAEERSMSVFVYVNTAKQIGDVEHLKIFETEDAAKDWLDENDPEGVAFEYEVLGSATGSREAAD